MNTLHNLTGSPSSPATNDVILYAQDDQLHTINSDGDVAVVGLSTNQCVISATTIELTTPEGASINMGGQYTTGNTALIIQSPDISFGEIRMVLPPSARAFTVQTQDGGQPLFISNSAVLVDGTLALSAYCKLQLAQDGVGGPGAASGIATLSGGTVYVPNTFVTASSHIFLSNQSGGTAPGFLYVASKSVGNGFTIQSTSATDDCDVSYIMVEFA